MPARKRETDSWWTDSEASPASGGHIAPAATTGPLLDPLEDSSSTPEEGGSGDDAASQEERTEVIPSGKLRSTEAQRWATPVRGSRYGVTSRPSLRRVKRTLRHVDPLSVLKLSLFYYGCFVIMGLVVVAILYAILSAVGLFESIEKLGDAFVLWNNLDITLAFVEFWTLLLGLIFAVGASLVNVFLAFLYNLAADVVGGAELTFVERDL